MDIRERQPTLEEMLAAFGNKLKSEIMTGFPVRVTKDSDGHTVSLQPLIRGVQRMPDGTSKQFDFPLIPSAPVNHVSGGGMTIAMPIREGDIGYAMIMCRSLDAYQQQGGLQAQTDVRMHDLSDAIFCPGLKPDPKKLANYDKESIQVRTDDGKHMVGLHPSKGPSLSADNGKHTVTVNPTSGIGIQTAMKLAVKATGGLDIEGTTHFKDAVTSATSFGAPNLNGQTGGIFTGIMGGFVGAVIGAGAVLLALATQQPGGAAVQVASVRAALIGGAQ